MNDDSCGTRAISRRVPAILCQREGNKWGIIRRHLAYVQQGSESIRFLRVACTTRSPSSSAYSWGFREQCFSLLLLCSIISKRGGIFETTRYYYIFFFFLTNLAFPVGEVRLFYSSLRRKVSFPVIEKGKIEILGNKIYSLSFKFPACLLSYAIFFDHLVDRSFSSSPWNEIAHGFPRSHRSTSLVT